jgi:Cu(I)/Ag(I) efflux system membrane protein CusA/SilA
MVVYLEEAVAKAIGTKRRQMRDGHPPSTGDSMQDECTLPTSVTLTRAELVTAVKAGARLRLRPKVMTVATAVASLLPIFWTSRTGTEIMRPLATPVIGGMVSSLLHILIVTPVIFLWLRERKLPKSRVASP